MISDKAEHIGVGRRPFPASVLAGCLLFVGLALLSPTATAQTASGSTDVVISQVYTRGGEPGATFRNDFIEFFNRGTTTINLTGYSLVISSTGPDATPDVTVGFGSSPIIPIGPGQYLLFQLGSSGNAGAFIIIPAEFNDSSINLGRTSGKIALVQSNSSAPLGCPVGQDPALVDYVAYGPASCAEGAAPATAPAGADVALIRQSAGCTDTDNNAADFSAGAPSPHNEFSFFHACTTTGVTNSIQFEVNQVDASEGQGSVEIFVTRSGNTSTPATVQYATIGQPSRQNGRATDRSDYSTAIGTLRFAPGETRKSFRILITDDAYFDGLQSLSVRLGSPTGNVALGALSTMTVNIADNDGSSQVPNPIDSTVFFVRQHYADFLSRDPDTSGLNFWTFEIEQCVTDTQCREVKRINVSAAFYQSIEFQETGFLVYRFFKASYPDSASRPRGFPTYREFLHDTQDISRGVVVGQGNWQAQLEANKQLAVGDFVERPEFKLRYPATLTPAQFVDALNLNAGGALSAAERDALVTGLQNGTETRATVLRRVAEDSDFRTAQFNRAFVLMEYFGYLRRNPNEAPDLDFTGYDFWLAKLNQFNGNFVQAEMVKAFITSSECRNRFAPQ
jgi:hypothetical protein